METPQSLQDVALADLPLMPVADIKRLCKNTKDFKMPEDFEELGKPELEKAAGIYIREKIGIPEKPAEAPKEPVAPVEPSMPNKDFPNLTNAETDDPVSLMEKMGYSDKKQILADLDAIRRERRQLEAARKDHEKRESDLVAQEQEMEGRQRTFEEKMKDLGIRKKENQDLLARIVEAKKS